MEATEAINLGPLVQTSSDVLAYFAAEFKLLAACYQLKFKNEDQLEPYLICALVFFQEGEEDFDKLDRQGQNSFCKALFYAHSWLRSVTCVSTLYNLLIVI